MMTPRQAFDLFIYADWAMMLVSLAALLAAIVWGLCAIILPRFKGRRKRQLLGAMKCFLVFATAWVTQISVMIRFTNDQCSPLQIALFVLPGAALLIALCASIVYGIHAVFKKSGAQRRRAVLESLLGVVVFAALAAPHTVAALIPIISAEDHSNRPGTLTKIGQPTPEFDVTTVDKKPFRTADLRGRVVVLCFFATWCGPCQMELPHLQSVWDEFRDNDDFRMLIVGREETDASVKAFQEQRGFTFPAASDPTGAIFHKYASRSIPRTYLIARDGTIVYQWTGAYETEIAKLKKLLTRELAKKP